MMKKICLVLILLLSSSAYAVHINPSGFGEVVLVPYYSVNNDLNTLVSVSNSQNKPKAVKINVREGLHGYAVLSFNVYLAADDSWTFAITATQSTLAGFEGQDSARLVFNDASCVVGLEDAGQEFNPSQIADGPNIIQRMREGFIEIIEMGELEGALEMAVTHNHSFEGSFISGLPTDCGVIDSAWEAGGIWHVPSGGNLNADINPVTGGLMVESNLIDVFEGVNYPIPTIAIDDFYEDETTAHHQPGDAGLSLDAAQNMAYVLTAEGGRQITFESGIDAVSATLMASQLKTDFALDPFFAGLTELVFSQPTRRFYIGFRGLNAQAPFSSDFNSRIWCPWEGDILQAPLAELSQYGGTAAPSSLISRDGYRAFINDASNISPIPPRFTVAICDSVSVWNLNTTYPDTINRTITASPNMRGSYDLGVKNGHISISINSNEVLAGTDTLIGSEVKMAGIPVIGVKLQKFTNASAGDGLLAQYGSGEMMRTRTSIITAADMAVD